MLGHFAIVPGVTTDRAGRTSPTLTAVAEPLQATARRWEVLEVAGHQDPRRASSTTSKKGTSSGSGSGGVPYGPGAAIHVVPELKHRKERISPSLLEPNFTDIAAAQRGLSLMATPRRGHESGCVGETLPAGSARPQMRSYSAAVRLHGGAGSERGRPSHNGDSVNPCACSLMLSSCSDGYVMALVPITTLGRHR